MANSIEMSARVAELETRIEELQHSLDEMTDLKNNLDDALQESEESNKVLRQQLREEKEKKGPYCRERPAKMTRHPSNPESRTIEDHEPSGSTGHKRVLYDAPSGVKTRAQKRRATGVPHPQGTIRLSSSSVNSEVSVSASADDFATTPATSKPIFADRNNEADQGVLVGAKNDPQSDQEPV